MMTVTPEEVDRVALMKMFPRWTAVPKQQVIRGEVICGYVETEGKKLSCNFYAGEIEDPWTDFGGEG